MSRSTEGHRNARTAPSSDCRRPPYMDRHRYRDTPAVTAGRRRSPGWIGTRRENRDQNRCRIFVRCWIHRPCRTSTESPARAPHRFHNRMRRMSLPAMVPRCILPARIVHYLCNPSSPGRDRRQCHPPGKSPDRCRQAGRTRRPGRDFQDRTPGHARQPQRGIEMREKGWGSCSGAMMVLLSSGSG